VKIKKYKNAIKKIGAFTLALALTVSGLPNLGGIVAHATELDENTYLSGQPDYSGYQYIGSDASALVYGNAASHLGTNGGTAHYTFDLAAIVNEADKNNNTKGYSTSTQAGDPTTATLKTSYGSNWFSAYYAFGKPYRVGAINDSFAPGSQPGDNNSADRVDPIPTYDYSSPARGGISSATQQTNLPTQFNPTSAGARKNGQVTTIPNPAGGNVEVRSEYKTSSDGRFIILEYTVFNDSNNATDFNIGHETDTQVYNHDHCPIIATEQSADGDTFEGLHMIANAGGTYQFTNFDVITYTPNRPIYNGVNAGMQKRDANDKSENRAWAGSYSSTGGVYHPYWVFAKSPAMLQGGFDSAGGFSAYFQLNAHETKTTRFALSMKPSVYYVKNGATGGTGFIAKPYGSIAEAVAGIKNAGTKKAYIYLMDDVPMDSTVTIDDGISITIETTDFVLPNGATYNTPSYGTVYYYGDNTATKPPIAYSGDNKTITRAANFKGDMFKVTGGASLTFTNVKVDAAGTDTEGTIVKVDDGTIATRVGSILTNNTIVEKADHSNADLASAIDVSGANSRIDMNYGTITGNKSVKGPAVRFNGKTDPANMQTRGTKKYDQNDESAAANAVYGFTVNNTVKIDGNTNAANSAANLRLAKNTRVRVKGALGSDSKIGVSIDNPAGPTEVKDIIADGMPGDTIYNYSTANFTNDLDGNTISMRDDDTKIPGGTTESSDPIILTAESKKLTLRFINEANGVALADAKEIEKLVGDSINLSLVTSGTPTGFEAIQPKISGVNWVAADNGFRPSGVEFTPATDAISAGADSAFNNAQVQITGTMPNSPIMITYKYKKLNATYYFDAKGGADIAPLTENATGAASTLALPTPTRLGYDFKGWTPFIDHVPTGQTAGNNRYDTADGDTLDNTLLYNPAAAGMIGTGLPLAVNERNYHYFATWQPSTTPYNMQVVHTSLGTRLQRNLATITDQKIVESRFDAAPLVTAPVSSSQVPGYKLSGAASTEVPAQEAWTGTTKFDPSNGYQYSVKVKPEDFVVTYKYAVDPSQTFPLTVIHKKSDGTVLNTSTLNRTVEQILTINPAPPTDFKTTSATITAGKTGNLSTTVAANPVRLVGTDDFKSDPSDPDFDSNFVFNGYMPNQPLTIEYVYAPVGDYFIYSTFKDSTDNEVIKRTSNSSAALVPITKSAPVIYGYLFNQSQSSDDPASGTFGADGSYNGNMPNANLNLNYVMDRDPSLWSNITFAVANAPYDKGVIVGSTTAPYLVDNGSAGAAETATTFLKLKNKNQVPAVNALEQPFYKFDGWYKDAAGTMKVNDTDTFNNAGMTLYAKFVEDPAYWVDLNFTTSDAAKGNVNPTGSNVPGGNPQHLKNDVLWSQVTPPATVPTANYELKNWSNPAGSLVNGSDRVVTGTYKANFGKVNAVWGLDPGAFGATGTIAPNGSGTVTVTGSTPGNKYIVVDPEGNIVGVAEGPADGSNVVFPNLVPGRTYRVLEGTPDTQATVGSPETSITGSGVSAPKPVTIPAIGDNKNVGVDPTNPERAQIVVNPADPDADYALIDSKGNVVNYPGSNNGWMTPVGSNPSTVTFNDLDPGETYTVVARKKGNSSETPLGNIDAGVAVVANPGDMVEAPKYIIETRTNGIGTNVAVVRTVGTEAVNANSYNQAKANSEFTIHADPTDSQGHAFKYWTIMNGRIPGVTAKITESDYSGKIAMGNVIFNAVYDIAPVDAFGQKIAPVEQGAGGSAAEGEFSLNPEEISAIENELANPTDKSLINVNGADVRYKVLFNKRNSKANEETAVKNSSTGTNVWSRYPDAFTSAYALDVKEERYVDGRLVQNASPSNATLKVVVQLPSQDADMLDYEVWDLGSNVDNHWNKVNPTTATQLTFTEDVENNAGLLSFDGNLNHTYVLVYAKTFKLYFIDNNPSKDHLHLGDTSKNFFKKIKVRKKGTVDSSEYASDYSVVTAYADGATPGTIKSSFDDILGITHTYVNWSKKDMPANISVFDPSAEVTKTASIFAYYNNNKPAVDKARVDLTNLIPVAKDLALSPYLFSDEVNELNQAIADAQNVLDRVRGRLENGIDPLRMANYPELQAAIDALQRIIDRMNQLVAEREGRVNARTGGRSGGGTGSPGSGGGGGSRTPLDGTRYKNMPLSGKPQITFTLGADGSWTINPITKRWSFTLNGGLPLNNRWARIDVSDGNGQVVSEWYRFDNQASLITGWYHDDEANSWFFLNPTDGKDMGKMTRGWYYDNSSNKWYYLNKESGAMAQGWLLDESGKWYYLDAQNGNMSTGWIQLNGKWYYLSTGNDSRPAGSMYVNERTPDGYMVNANGEWIQ
jgi:hypothetical protein